MTAEPETGDVVAERSTDLQPRELIVSIFGLYARAESNWLSVASVVRLMTALDVDGASVRSSISRLKRRGTLEAHRHDGSSGYSISGPTLEALAEGDVRIFDRRRGEVEDGWLMVVFSIPETERDKRHVLRTFLTRMGFGTTAPGVWIAPGGLAREVREMLERRGLTEYVDMYLAEHLGFGDLRTKVRTWWDLDVLGDLYANFLDRYRPVLERSARETLPLRDAFAQYVPMLTEWRRLPYLDPGLPLGLLPPGWNGVTAGKLFDQLNAELSGPAREYAMLTIRDS